jgi:2-polyprenyl-6-hydroxyphenyl methylase/3-demethylubiquinone-9 3-methyltransferase
VERFAKLAADWWNPSGKFRPLHQLAPARLSFVRDETCRHFSRDARDLSALTGLTVLDVGCGGGLMSEPVARMGARVTGIDPAEANVRAAAAHADESGVEVVYRAAMVEALVAEGLSYDAVMCLEVVEHVPDPAAFLIDVGRLVRPGGLLLLSTINRTLKSFALAIVGAEHILRWLPVGTHQWDRFITPEELEGYVTAAGLRAGRRSGLVYDVLRDEWRLADDTGVNYLMAAAMPNAAP